MIYEAFEGYLGSWGPYLKSYIEGKEFNAIYDFLKMESKRFQSMTDGVKKRICPDSTSTYRAFKETPFEELKVVWLLQDPYPWIKDKKFVADGIAMSCANTGIFQPSLELFYDGIEDDLHKGLNLNIIRDPDLKYLCNQGIMMMNTALTVESNKPRSHSEIWKPFTKNLLENVLGYNYKGEKLIFVLAGKESQYFEKYIDPLKHHILKVEHPAAAAHSNRSWNHGGIFTKINYLLKSDRQFKPNWLYEEAPF